MKLKLHHINLCTDNVPALNRFYRDVLTLGDEAPAELPPLNKEQGLVGDVAFVTDGAIQMHLTPRDVLNSFRSGHVVNPLDRGHIAYRTDDIAAFMRHLEEKGVPYSDWGSDAVKGWHQIFFYDPDGIVIEVHQIVESTEDNAAKAVTAAAFPALYEAALRSQDWSRVAPLIHDTACVVFSNGVKHVGKTAIQAAYQANFDAIEGEDFRLENLQWLNQSPESAGYMFDFAWSGRVQGRSVGGAGLGTAVLICRNGAWQLLAEHLGPREGA